MNVEFDTWFKENFQRGLAHSSRFETMYIALNHCLNKGGTCLVETGTMRMADNWDDGKSTLIFGSFCKKYNHHLHTADINPESVELSRQITEPYSNFISYSVTDSVLFLKNFNHKIDLLYLDSMNCPANGDVNSLELVASQQHQLHEIQAAYDKLSDDPIILLDDNDFENGGKTKLSKAFLQQKGFTEIMSWKQSLWVKEV